MKKYFNLFLITVCLSISTLGNGQEPSKKGFAVSVNSKTEKSSMTKEEFKTAKFSLHSYNSEKVENINLKGFSVKYPGQKSIIVEGNKLNKEAIHGLLKLEKGDQIVIYDGIIENESSNSLISIKPIVITIR